MNKTTAHHSASLLLTALGAFLVLFVKGSSALLPGTSTGISPQFLPSSIRSETEIHTVIAQNLKRPFSERITAATVFFNGRPYSSAGPLGEGVHSEYDQDPLYRTDAFDCTTYVETIIAIAHAKSFEQFKSLINKIRYHRGQVLYQNRNHFFELDWKPNNEALGFFKDITPSLPHAELIVQKFNKKLWYESKKVHTLDLQELPNEETTRLVFLKKEFLSEIIPTLPIPSILNIVRKFDKPPPGFPAQFVSHQVLLVSDHGTLRIRQATSRPSLHKVIDQSVEEFISSPLMKSSFTLGVNILKLNEKLSH